MENINEKIIKDAQYRKGLSIAFFNANNAAIEIVKKEIESEPRWMENPDVIKKSLVKWRNWLLEEHKNYYATVIANIGSNYNAKETIEKLKSIKTEDELRTAWQSLSTCGTSNDDDLSITSLSTGSSISVN